MSWDFQTEPLFPDSFAPLVRDLLSGKLTDVFPKTAPNMAFPAERRQLLVDVLLDQAIPDLHEAAKANMLKLTEANAFTVNTGHQLNLATGPLFTIAKILSAIAHARRLNREQSTYKAIPVFWLASEDHDLEEIRHIEVFGRRYTWEREQEGAVGRMSTHGLPELINALIPVFERDKDATFILESMSNALEATTFGAFTREFYQRWLGHLGLVVIDADDARLKRAFLPIMQHDILQQGFHEALITQTESLQKRGYTAQVTVKNISHFYLTATGRNRIEWQGDKYVISNGQSFSKPAMEEELSQNPERFSPNVCLRPIYQEFILPGWLYIGGPAEVAYWAQLVKAFEVAKVPMPEVKLRHSIQVIPHRINQTIDSFHMPPASGSLVWNDWESDFLEQRMQPISWETTDAHFEAWLSVLKANTLEGDAGFNTFLEASLVRSKDGYDQIKKKYEKSLKDRFASDLSKLRKAYDFLYPTASDGKQERGLYLLAACGWINHLNEVAEAMSQSGEILIKIKEVA